MKSLLIMSMVAAFGLAACSSTPTSPQRQAVLKEMSDFKAKCESPDGNYWDKECVNYREMYRTSGSSPSAAATVSDSGSSYHGNSHYSGKSYNSESHYSRAK